ncbi:MAG: DUF3181 family protein [Cyanobacteria bacterium Co-bin13]|nr:DUF3181 family protein [Cyanobacteria bacterium Co-bin13]
MAYSTTSEAIEALAAEIGENIYLDIAKWHLYLGDAKLHTPLAERLYPLLQNRSLSENAVNDALQTMTVAIGGGRRQLPLAEFLPSSGQRDLMRLLEDYQNKL